MRHRALQALPACRVACRVVWHCASIRGATPKTSFACTTVRCHAVSNGVGGDTHEPHAFYGSDNVLWYDGMYAVVRTCTGIRLMWLLLLSVEWHIAICSVACDRSTYNCIAIEGRASLRQISSCTGDHYLSTLCSKSSNAAVVLMAQILCTCIGRDSGVRSQYDSVLALRRRGVMFARIMPLSWRHSSYFIYHCACCGDVSGVDVLEAINIVNVGTFCCTVHVILIGGNKVLYPMVGATRTVLLCCADPRAMVLTWPIAMFFFFFAGEIITSNVALLAKRCVGVVGLYRVELRGY